jgi:hypothetical protein
LDLEIRGKLRGYFANRPSFFLLRSQGRPTDREELADGGAGDSGDEEHGGGLESEEEDVGNHVGRSPAADADGGGAGTEVNAGGDACGLSRAPAGGGTSSCRAAAAAVQGG